MYTYIYILCVCECNKCLHAKRTDLSPLSPKIRHSQCTATLEDRQSSIVTTLLKDSMATTDTDDIRISNGNSMVNL